MSESHNSVTTTTVCRPRCWTREETQCLIAGSHLGARTLASELGRSACSVEHRANRLGLSLKQEWSQVCLKCGADLPPRGEHGRPRLYCSEACRTANHKEDARESHRRWREIHEPRVNYPEITCRQCGRVFLPKAKNQRYCSKQCMRRAFLERHRDEWAAAREAAAKESVYGGRAWEIDLDRPGAAGQKVWARNPLSWQPSAREWHLVAAGAMRKEGFAIPLSCACSSWEVDWSKVRRSGSGAAWARSPNNAVAKLREWHWAQKKTLKKAGLKWPYEGRPNRSVNKSGYVSVCRTFFSAEEVALLEPMFGRGGKGRIMEHRAVMALWLGHPLSSSDDVHHINGKKDDNRIKNLMLATTRRDHHRQHARVIRELSEANWRIILLERCLRENGLAHVIDDPEFAGRLC